MAVLWLRFLKEVEEHQSVVSDDLRENADIRKALDICEEGAFTDGELAAYDKYWDIIRTENALLDESRAEGRAEGEAKGREEGRVEGRVEGEAKGREEGKAEGRAEGEAKGRVEGKAEGREESLAGVVLNCKRNGFSLSQIQAITGLGEERILEILRSNSEG
jgi:flagellar biosynthesis/type III secretory pathway protein FliH